MRDASAYIGNVTYVTTKDYDSNTRTQTFELEISGNINTADTTYTCKIIPRGGAGYSTTLIVDVFSKCTTVLVSSVMHLIKLLYNVCKFYNTININIFKNRILCVLACVCMCLCGYVI